MSIKEEIISNTASPLKLEELYRLNPAEFIQSFSEVYETIKGQPIAEFWRSRLQFESQPLDETVIDLTEPVEKKFNITFTIIAALLAGTFIKIGDILGLPLNEPLDEYVRDNIAFFVLPLLCIYYIIKNKAQTGQTVIFGAAVIISVLFMNLVPWEPKSDTQLLSSMHIVFIMWAFLGLAFTSFDIKAHDKQMQFIRRNGDVVVLTGIIIICGMSLTALTQGLFQAIGIKLTEQVFKHIAMYGLGAAPIVANYMVESSPRIINRVTPFISKIFTPLILILMTVFIIALVFFAKDPFTSRQELIVFNVLLAVNMAVIVFSFSAEAGKTSKAGSFQNKVLLILSGEALLINLIALCAIVYRLFAFGVSPNRIAVLGVNTLMFINLVVIALKLYGFVRAKQDTEAVHKSMTMMLPWYTIWAAIAAFVFPFIFWFK
jgi:hypothetical protein